MSNLNRIFYLQKRVVRAITNSDYRAHSAPLFAKLGIFDIFQVNSFQIAKFMFYYHNQLLPQVFLNLFLTSCQVHNYGTRTASRYRSHSCGTNLKQFTILYQGPKVWNSLPISITSSSSFLTFKKNCWSFYFKIMNWPCRTYKAPHFLFINDSRGGLSYKPGGFLRSPRHYLDL